MANIPVIAEINNLLDADTTAIAKTALGVLGAATKGDIVAADIANDAVTTAKILDANVTAAKLATSAVDLTTSTVTGTLPVNKGGTGAATLTANNVLIGAGTSAPTFVAPSTAGNVLTSNGTTWVSSGGSTPTNATVNTAINTDPAETRYALSVERKQNFGTSIQNLRGQTSKNLRVVTFGDSLVAQGTPLNLSGVIPSAGGFCEAEQSLNVSGTTSLVSDWTYPGGRHAVITTGGTRRWGRYFATAAAYPFNHASIFKIFYIRGTGTLKLRSATGVSGTFADITGSTAIDTSTGGAAGTIGVYTVTLTPGNVSNFYRIDTECTAGTVKILCVQALADVTGSRDSYHLSCVGLGGSFDTEWILCPQANWTAVLTEMNPHLIVFKAADFHIANKTTAGDWATVLDRIRVASPNAVMLLIDSHPHSTNTDPAVDNTGWSAGLKAYAALNAPMVQFVECRKFWPNYDTMRSSAMISADGIHLTDPIGRAFESALVLDHVSTLTVAPHINETLNAKIFSRLAGVTGTVQSAYLSSPEWAVTGDLYNANGYIGLFNQYGAAPQVGQGAHLIGFSTQNSNNRVANGLGLGLSRTSHQLLVQSRVNNRVIIGNLGNTETALTKDSDAQLEVFGNSATVVTLAASCITGQTANIFEVKTSATLAASGTLATAFGPAGALITVPVGHTATTAAVDVNTPTTSLTTTAPAQAITLANGVAGQIKTITHVATSGSGTAVLTPATKTGYTTITFTAVGDTVTMQYYATIGWVIISIRGAVAA